MIFRPIDTGGFQFVIVSSLRAAQLMRGCTPRVLESHKHTSTALREVAQGKVSAVPGSESPPVMAPGVVHH